MILCKVKNGPCQEDLGRFRFELKKKNYFGQLLWVYSLFRSFVLSRCSCSINLVSLPTKKKKSPSFTIVHWAQGKLQLRNVYPVMYLKLGWKTVHRHPSLSALFNLPEKWDLQGSSQGIRSPGFVPFLPFTSFVILSH